MVILALDIVKQCYSAADGSVVYHAIRPHLQKGDQVKLSFDGVYDVPSSFVNAAIVSLLNDYSEDWIKSHLTISDATVQIADMTRRCLSNGVRKKSLS